MNGLITNNCCCDASCSLLENGEGPSTLQITSVQTWASVFCERNTRGPNMVCCWTTTNLPGYDPPGCPGAGFNQYSVSQFTSTQTVTRTVSGTLYKDSANNRYVGNFPAAVPESDGSVSCDWSVDVSGSGTKQQFLPNEQFFDRIGSANDYRLCFGCWDARPCATSYSDGGTIFPRVQLACVSSSAANCNSSLPPDPVFGRLNISSGDPSSSGGLAQYPTRIWLPSSNNNNPVGASEMAWPPILPDCPLPSLVNGGPWQTPIDNFGSPPDPCPDSSMSVCPNCGAVFPNLASCWSCRTTCVPFQLEYGPPPSFQFLGRVWPSPVGYGTTWVPINGIVGSYRLIGHSQELDSGWISGTDHGSDAWRGGCPICDGGEVDFSCPLPEQSDPSWCYWTDIYGDQGAFKMVASGSLTLS